MQFCKIFIGDSDYKIFFKEKYTVFCRNTLIIKTALIYLMTYFPKYNVNDFIFPRLKSSKKSYFQKDRPESRSEHIYDVILMSPS